MTDMLILGAGPAGLACGIAAAMRGTRVVILEKNDRPGVKLRISGSGQCNLTHGGSIEQFLNRYGDTKKSRFVKPALFAFSNTDTMRFFEQHGVSLFERENGKIFPRSLQSDDVVHALVDTYQANGGDLITGVDIHAVLRTSEGFLVKTNQGAFASNQLVIATGGMSYPRTGSTGDGYSFARKLGHRIVPPRPALTPVIVEQYPFAAAAGISFEDVPISLYRKSNDRNGKKIRQGRGDVLLTHHGLSGPGILDLSRFLEPKDTLHFPICRNVVDLKTLLTGKRLLKNALFSESVASRC